MNSILLTQSWRQFLTQVLSNPQGYVAWVIIFLVVSFLLSRLRNILEERGVNRAIYISRGLVGTLMSFIIAPIVFYIVLNIMALIHQVNTINISFLAQWLGLTLTSYWWLLKCFFGSESLSGATEIYSVHSIIRMLWVLLPFSFVWMRVSKSRIGKLFLIPLIIGTFVITRYKHAPPTFITEDTEIVNRIPGLRWFTKDAIQDVGGQQSLLSSKQRQIMTIGLGAVIVLGLITGLYLEYRIIGLFITLVGLLGFLLISPHEKERVIAEEHQENYNLDVKRLIFRMDSLYREDPEDLEIYQLSLQIEAAYEAKIAVGDMVRFPDSLCNKYESYFYDWCKE